MSARTLLDYVVLDALANDLENLEDIERILNNPSELGWRDQHPLPFTREEIVPSLLRAIRERLVEVCRYTDDKRALAGLGEGTIPTTGLTNEDWFRLTDRGRTVLNSWEAPPLPNS